MESPKTTVVYYSANTENPRFEQKVIDNIKKQAEGLPIISVTRKPIDLGDNICINETPICYSNSFKQLLIGLEAARTEFCIATESDCLYPPEYFQFVPPLKDQVYRYTNLYVHFDGRDKFWKKKWVEAAQMCGREYWIKCIEKILINKIPWTPMGTPTHWSKELIEEYNNSWEPEPFKFVFEGKDEYSWTGKNPVAYCKTRHGVNFKTGFIQGSVNSIPYWGNAVDFRKKYLE